MSLRFCSKFIVSIFFVGVSAATEAVSSPERLTAVDPPDVEQAKISDFCRSGLEGTFRGSIGSIEVLTSILCTGDNRMVAVVSEDDADPGSAGYQSFAQSIIDHEYVLFTNFSSKNEDRRGISSKSTMTYLKLRIDELRKGNLLGLFHGGNLGEGLVVRATKHDSLPTWKCEHVRSSEAEAITGTYVFESPTLGKVSLFVDILSDTPVMTIVVPGQKGFQLMDGPPWDGTGCVTSFTAEGDGGEPDARALQFIRGQFQGEQFRFVWVNSRGVQGTFTAKRALRSLVPPK